VLDVGCALGDAIPVWRGYYPDAELFGCDVAEVCIARCIQQFGKLAKFFKAGFEDLRGKWDVIYCSNVLEHFETPAAIAEVLLRHCKILYVMTPYRELRGGHVLTADGSSFHVVSLFRETFDSIPGATVRSRVIRAPGAWSLPWSREIEWQLHRVLCPSLGPPPRQIVYTITSG